MREVIEPDEARAAYAASDDTLRAHERGCSVCSQTRVRRRVRCDEGADLFHRSIELWDGWRDAIAAARLRGDLPVPAGFALTEDGRLRMVGTYSHDL